MKTGERMSLRGYLAMVCTHTAMKPFVSDSVPVHNAANLFTDIHTGKKNTCFLAYDTGFLTYSWPENLTLEKNLITQTGDTERRFQLKLN